MPAKLRTQPDRLLNRGWPPNEICLLTSAGNFRDDAGTGL